MFVIVLRVAAFLCFAVLTFGLTVGSLRLLPLGFALWLLSDLLAFYYRHTAATATATPPV